MLTADVLTNDSMASVAAASAAVSMRLIVTIARAAPEPVALTPCSALAFFTAIFGLSAAPAFCEFAGVRFPATAEH